MIEFFNHHSQLTEEESMAIIDKHYMGLTCMLDEESARRILLILINDRRACEVIMKIKAGGLTDPIQIIKQFIACNWDALEVLPDITDRNELNFEYVNCGFKGASKKCPFSMPGDPKPYCIIKSQYNIPNYAYCTDN